MRRKIIKENPDKFENHKKAERDADKYDGLKYIINFVPVLGSSGGGMGSSEYPISSQINSKIKEETRHISY